MMYATLSVRFKIRRLLDANQYFIYVCSDISFVLYVQRRWSTRNMSVFIKEEIFVIYALNGRVKQGI
jgi:hypothetical protein